jgi:transcriptional regulator with XRE-family HTH domain
MVPNGQRVRTLREKRGWTQDELASSSGTTERTVQRIEANRSVSIDSLRLLASALNVEFSDLLPSQAPQPPERESTSQQDPELQIRYEKRRELVNTVAKLCGFWEDHVPGSRLTDREHKNVEKWLRSFRYEEILAAMDNCIQEYVQISPNGLSTTSSCEFAWSRIPRVCYVERLEPEERELYRIRGSARQRLIDFDDREGIYLLKAAQKAGASIEKLREYAAAVRDWDAFKEGLGTFIRVPSAELSLLPRSLREPTTEVLRALPGNGATSNQESIAIVAATKRLAATPEDIADEILQRASEYGEIVITIDVDRRAYYFGQSRDGSGRMYGIHQSWAARELAEALRNGFEFLPRSSATTMRERR